jgi:plastocyanin
MVFFAPLIGAAAIFSRFASAAPTPDSAIGEEVAVSAPNGIIMSDTAALATQTAQAVNNGYSSGSNSGYGSSSNSGYGGSMNSGSGSNYGSGSGSMGNNGGKGSNGGYGSNSGSNGMMSSSMMMGSNTMSAASSYSTPSWGSGSSNMGGNSGYNSCVQQCVATYGAPPSSYTPSSTSSGGSSSGGNGVTHTVIVAPTQGVLRYVPFALNASVGDTVQFMWNANNHTVTKSSELLPCNKTADSPFASGVQLKGFSFTQVVNDTNPTFYYCGVPTHCEKGMFGIINPPNAFGGSQSVDNSLSGMASNDSSVAAMASYASHATANNQGAASWGGSMDMSSLPSWSHQYFVQNTLYTRTFLASNPEVLNADGSIDLSNAGSNPLMIPQDISAVVNDANSTSTASSPSATSGGSSAASSSAAYPSPSSNGAGSLSSSSVLIAAMAVVATFFAL